MASTVMTGGFMLPNQKGHVNVSLHLMIWHPAYSVVLGMESTESPLMYTSMKYIKEG